MTPKLVSLLLVLTSTLAGCGNQTVSEDKQPGPVDSAGLPDSEVLGAEIHLYNRGAMTIEIRAERIVRFDAVDSTMGYVVDVDFFDSAGQVTSNLVADSGIIHENSGQLQVYGHVVVNTRDSIRLDTDSLVFDPTTNKIQTDAFVKVSRPGDTITGWGLEAPRDLSRFKILHQVSGRISDPEKLSGQQ